MDAVKTWISKREKKRKKKKIWISGVCKEFLQQANTCKQASGEWLECLENGWLNVKAYFWLDASKMCGGQHSKPIFLKETQLGMISLKKIF